MQPALNTMSSREWFILAARVIGVWVLYNAMTYLAAFAEFFIGYRVETERDNSRTYMVQAVFHLVFALYLMFGTRHLARQIYGNEKCCTETEPLTPSNEKTNEK